MISNQVHNVLLEYNYIRKKSSRSNYGILDEVTAGYPHITQALTNDLVFYISVPPSHSINAKTACIMHVLELQQRS